MNYTPLTLNNKKNLVEAIKVNRYIIGSIDIAGTVNFSKNPATHADSYDARSECSRLSKLSPGKIYFFAQIIGGEEFPAVIDSFSY